MPRISLQKFAPPLVCAMLLALAAALGTHFALQTLYGVPAPAPQAPRLATTSISVPVWLAGGAAVQVSELSLLGVVAQSADGKQGLALLQASSGDRAKVYAVGQTLPNGAVLQAVAARSVTLNAQGQLQTVQLDLKASAGAAVNPQRGVGSTVSTFTEAQVQPIQPIQPNPMGAAGMVINPAVLNAQVNANQARLAAKRLRADPAAAPQGQRLESQGEQQP